MNCSHVNYGRSATDDSYYCADCYRVVSVKEMLPHAIWNGEGKWINREDCLRKAFAEKR